MHEDHIHLVAYGSVLLFTYVRHYLVFYGKTNPARYTNAI